MQKLHVKLVKSPIGSKPVHKKNLEALGLRKLNQVKEHNNTHAIQGMISKVIHLVEVEDK